MYQELEEMRARIKELEAEVVAAERYHDRRIKELEAEAEGTQEYVEFLKATLIQDTVPEAYLTRLERAERVVEATRRLYHQYRWGDLNHPLVKAMCQALADYDREA